METRMLIGTLDVRRNRASPRSRPFSWRRLDMRQKEADTVDTGGCVN